MVLRMVYAEMKSPEDRFFLNKFNAGLSNHISVLRKRVKSVRFTVNGMNRFV
jgi:hypothetical protein